MPELDRSRSPLSNSAWRAIDGEATDVLNACLSARRLCDIVHSEDWSRSALPLGSARPLELDACENGRVSVREARPLLEIRVPFALDREVIRELERNSPVPDLGPVAEAAREFARIEDRIIYGGVEGIGAPGLRSHNEHRTLPVPSVTDIPAVSARAVELLRAQGVAGPYAFVPSSTMKTQLLSELLPSGRPVMSHLQRTVDGVGTPTESFDGALVCSLRGGDFRLHLGRGVHISFEWETSDALHFALVQSMALEFGGREAVVCLAAPDGVTVEALPAKPQMARRRPEPGARDQRAVERALKLGIDTVEASAANQDTHPPVQ